MITPKREKTVVFIFIPLKITPKLTLVRLYIAPAGWSRVVINLPSQHYHSRRKKQTVFIVICAGVIAVQGCAVALVGAGAGSVAYLKGDLEAVLDKNVDQAYQATLKALDKLEISATKKEKDALSAVIIGRTAEDKKVAIKLKAAENNLTKLSIRIGMFGNRAQSQVIYDEIRKHL